MSVARQVLSHAATRPQGLAIRCDGRLLSYGQLGAKVRAVAGSLCAGGLRPGRLAALSLANPADLLTVLLAVDLVGATPLVCDARWETKHLTEVLASVSPDTCIETMPGHTTTESSVTEVFGWKEAAPDDLAWAGFTSGSTGRPRAVVRSRASWTGSYDAVSRIFGITAADVVLVPGPLASSLYGFAALHALAVGATVEVGTRWTPRLLAERAAEADVVHLVPSAVDDLLARLGKGKRLKTMVAGGAALPAGVRSQARTAGVEVIAYYGAAELSFVAVDADGSGLRPFPGVEIDVRAEPGSAVGEVWVRSPWLSAGYLGGVAGPYRRDSNGWATVGDLADAADAADERVDAADERADVIDRAARALVRPLRLRGRGDGAIITSGATVVPEDVEAVLTRVPGVAEVVVVGTAHERLGAVVTAVIEHTGSAVPRSILEAAARRGLSPAQRPRRWVVVDTMPRTVAGKPARSAITDRLTSGLLPGRPLI